MGIKYSSKRLGEPTEHKNGSRSFRTADPFASLAKVENCPCEDGKRRTVHATAEPDTFFSIPAVTYVGRKSVAGFLSLDGEEGYRFAVYSRGKNAALIPAKSST